VSQRVTANSRARYRDLEPLLYRDMINEFFEAAWPPLDPVCDCWFCLGDVDLTVRSLGHLDRLFIER